MNTFDIQFEGNIILSVQEATARDAGFKGFDKICDLQGIGSRNYEVDFIVIENEKIHHVFRGFRKVLLEPYEYDGEMCTYDGGVTLISSTPSTPIISGDSVNIVNITNGSSIKTGNISAKGSVNIVSIQEGTNVDLIQALSRGRGGINTSITVGSGAHIGSIQQNIGVVYNAPPDFVKHVTAVEKGAKVQNLEINIGCMDGAKLFPSKKPTRTHNPDLGPCVYSNNDALPSKKCIHPNKEDIRLDVKMLDDDDEDKACVICLNNRKKCVGLPCGHISLCIWCSTNVGNWTNAACPICREPLHELKITY